MATQQFNYSPSTTFPTDRIIVAPGDTTAAPLVRDFPEVRDDTTIINSGIDTSPTYKNALIWGIVILVVTIVGFLIFSKR